MDTLYIAEGRLIRICPKKLEAKDAFLRYSRNLFARFINFFSKHDVIYPKHDIIFQNMMSCSQIMMSSTKA